MKEKLEQQFFGIIVAGLSLLASIAFTVLLLTTKLLPIKIVIIFSVFAILWSAGIFLISRNRKRVLLSVIGCVMAIILLVVEILSSVYIIKGVSALNNITTPQTELAEIGVFVRVEDDAKIVEDTAGRTFGIIDVLDRASSDLALKELERVFGEKQKITTFEGIIELLDGLLDEKVDVIILSTSLLELLDETVEDYEGLFLSKIRQIHTIKIELPKDDKVSSLPQLPQKRDGAFIVYITGIDTRSDLIWKNSRSDVNILAAVNPKSGQIALISTPRDYYVPLSISDGIPDKLTHSGIYGVQVSIDTMEMIYDVDIDYYFKLNFVGFKNIIDALGGITVISDVAFSPSSTINFVKGANHLDGQMALIFARNRYALAGGDRHRGIHQMAVINGVIDKVLSPAVLTNYTEFLNSISGSFETSVPYELVAKLVRNQLSDGTDWKITNYAVNGKGASRNVYSLSGKAYVMLPDQTTIEKAKEIMNDVLYGRVPNKD